MMSHAFRVQIIRHHKFSTEASSTHHRQASYNTREMLLYPLPISSTPSKYFSRQPPHTSFDNASQLAAIHMVQIFVACRNCRELKSLLIVRLNVGKSQHATMAKFAKIPDADI